MEGIDLTYILGYLAQGMVDVAWFLADGVVETQLWPLRCQLPWRVLGAQ